MATKLALFAVAAALIASVVANDDPTISLPGVQDLSEYRSRSLGPGAFAGHHVRPCTVVVRQVIADQLARAGLCTRAVVHAVGMRGRSIARHHRPCGCTPDPSRTPPCPAAAAPDNFDQFVNGGQFAMVEFYA